MIRIAAISDLHGILPKIAKCDLLLIAGDIAPLKIQSDRTQSVVWFFQTFLEWVKEVPCEEIFIIAGNHDKELAQNYPVARALEYLSDFKITYLLNDVAVYRAPDGKNLKVYGSPQCHKFGNWAFMAEEPILKELYASVPAKIDIWLTHDTPKTGDLDLLPPSQWNPQPVHAGGESLAKAIKEVSPKLVICGHLHTCKDKYLEEDGIKYCNVSIVNNEYDHVYSPTYIDWDNDEITLTDSLDITHD